MARTPPSSPAVPLAGAGLPDETPVEGLVATYGTVIEAEMARGRLEAAGIDARVVDAHTVGVAHVLSVAVGGVKVVVATEDLEEAREILARPALVDDADAAAAFADVEAPATSAPPTDGRRTRAAIGVAAAAVALAAGLAAALL